MKRIMWVLLVFASSRKMQAQDHMQGMTDTAKHPMHMKDHRHGKMEDMKGMEGMQDMAMSHAFSLNLPMNRNGSGTGWVPDASPMFGYMVHANGWMFMFHGDIFPRYNNQDMFNKGSRGGEKWDAPTIFTRCADRSPLGGCDAYYVWCGDVRNSIRSVQIGRFVVHRA